MLPTDVQIKSFSISNCTTYCFWQVPDQDHSAQTGGWLFLFVLTHGPKMIKKFPDPQITLDADQVFALRIFESVCILLVGVVYVYCVQSTNVWNQTAYRPGPSRRRGLPRDGNLRCKLGWAEGHFPLVLLYILIIIDERVATMQTCRLGFSSE